MSGFWGTGKICRLCHTHKPTTSFPKHSQHKDGLDSRCSDCKDQHRKLVSAIKKTAPEKPSVCDCCGKPPNSGLNYDPTKRKSSLVLDHVNSSFRGWICSSCNLILGGCGDNIEGVTKFIRYLEKTNE